MHSGGPTTFQPTPAAIDQLIDDLGNPEASIASLAANHHTTTEALCLWMAQPDIAERIAQSNNIITWRTRLIAAASLSSVVCALTRILNNFNTAQSAQHEPNPIAAPSASDSPASDSEIRNPKSEIRNPQDAFRSLVLDWRAAETARKSCQLLLRLANLNPVGLPRALQPAAANPDDPAATPADRPAHSTSPNTPALKLAGTEAAPRPAARQSRTPGREAQNNNTSDHEPPALRLDRGNEAPDNAPASNSLKPDHQPQTTSFEDFEPPPEAVAQLEAIFFNILENKPHLEPALNRFVAEIQQADHAIRSRPP